MNQQPVPMGQKNPTVSKWLWITLIIVVVLAGVFAAWYFLMGPGKTVASPTATTTSVPTSTTKTTATSGTTTPTTTDLTYTNSTYGFTLTFPATWKGYKMKEASFEDSTATYYINVPTTDATFSGDTIAEAGYYSPFAISVYTLDQWAALEALEGPKGILITKNGTYAFAWSQANGVPPSDWTKNADIETIIASFKLQ